jgi:hypothetical protein
MNPLQFDALEPHRFEDLIRQLAYKFRRWRYLDATGRLGNDEGADIRGLELVAGVAQGSDDEDQAEEEPSFETDRSWVIQCKRVQRMTPKQLQRVVTEAVPDVANAPYGLVVAVACDVSADALSTFRAEAIARNVREAHVWSRAHLEDLLFQPDNDHLLFAYFGISISLRQQARSTAIRRLVMLKKKLLKLLDVRSPRSDIRQEVLIRSIDDDLYPREFRVLDIASCRVMPWHTAIVDRVTVSGPRVRWATHHGYLNYETGEWVIAVSDGPELMHARYDAQAEYPELFTDDSARPPTPQMLTNLCLDVVLGGEPISVAEYRLLPYENIIELDEIGDRVFPIPHMYCRYTSSLGPYVLTSFYATRRGHPGEALLLDEELRRHPQGSATAPKTGTEDHT